MNCSRHEPGVLDADAEAERSHLRGIEHPLPNCVEDPLRADVVAREDAFELGGDISTALEADAPEVSSVTHAEVVKRAEQSLIERLPEPHLGGDAIVEPVHDLLAVRSLGRRSQADEHPRLQVLEQPRVCVCLGVVELVDDDDIELRRIELVDRRD